MKFKFLLLFLFTLFILVQAKGQDSGFGIWYGLNAEFAINKKIEIDLSGNLRTYNKGKNIDQTFLEGGLTYKFNKYLSTEVSYRFTEKVERDQNFYPRHKLFLTFKGTLPAGNFDFSSRVMLQYQNKTYIEKLSDEIPEYALRIKLKAIYRIPSFPVNPYLYYESFSGLNGSSTHIIDKERFSAGFELKITRMQSVDIEYILQRDFEPRIYNMNIISLNYNLKF
jgi:hypothetical protein